MMFWKKKINSFSGENKSIQYEFGIKTFNSLQLWDGTEAFNL